MPVNPVSSRWALISLAASMLLSSLGTSVANVGLPTLAQAFDASFQSIQWVVLAYLLAITTLIVSAGRLGDVFGRRRVLLTGLLVFTLASALCSVAPTLAWLIAARALQGAGAAAMMALTMAFIGDIVPKEKTGSAMGLLATMSATGTALGPSLGGLMITGAGWRALFFVTVPLGLITYVMARRFLPVDARDTGDTTRQRPSVDVPGTIVLAVALGAYALAMTVGRGHYGVINIVLLGLAVCATVLFVYVERHVASPLIRLGLFRNVVLRSSLIMTALVSTVMMTTLVVGPFYLSRVFGLDALSVGLILATGPVVAALTGVPAGKMVDRFDINRVTIAGLTAIAVAAFTLALCATSLSLVGYVSVIALMTMGYALFQTANNTIVMTGVSQDQRGVIGGMLNLARNLGLITGASVMGAVFSYALAVDDINIATPQASAVGMGATFALATVLIVMALIMAWHIDQKKRASVGNKKTIQQ